MAFKNSLLGLLLVALVLAEDEVNITFFEPDFAYDSNLTAILESDRFNVTWQHVAYNHATTTSTTYTVPTTMMTPPKTTSITFRPPVRIPFVPHHHHGPRWGPYFEDGVESQNITARVGSTVRLDCKIGMLQDKTVTWLHRKQDSIHLLTVGRQAYSSDQRITLSFRYPNNWRLEILYVTRRDAGLYECQVATHPPRVKSVHLTVTAPEVVIMDEKHHETSERYYKAGSAVELTCLATHIESPTDSVTWRLGTVTLKDGVSYNHSLGNTTVIATLTISQAEKSHSGNYTCAVGELASAVVAVHILNGELPAAVHGNCGHSITNPKISSIVVISLAVGAYVIR